MQFTVNTNFTEISKLPSELASPCPRALSRAAT
jgi:hypothetical protein